MITCYVISRQFGGTVAHEGDRESCKLYIRTCGELWGHPSTDYVIAEGRAAVKPTLALIRRQSVAR